jgi:prepilin-type N-terminal cleavage/methylation domain-containing protein
MNFATKRSASRGFTLIELLIVVIIVAILAAIAIPQFTSSTTDAQAAAVDANLATVRSAIEMYKAQHNGIYPGDVATAGTGCPSGTGVTATADTAAALTAQLQGYSNAAGQTCSAPAPGFKYGPYLRQGLPSEPIHNTNAVVVTQAGTPIVATAVGGWAYDTQSGQFIMNSTDNDTGNPARAYSTH